MIYENFREVKLRDICSKVCDGDWIETKDQGGTDYRLLQISNIGTGNFVETDKYRWISNKKFEELQCNEILNGDVLIARMPEPIGRCWWVDKLPWRAITSVDVTIARPLPKEVDGRYLSYYINSPRTLARLNNLSTGTTRMRVRRKDLADLTIHLPTLKEQKVISNVLGTIDDKIELNIKTNETLEDMAKAIFKSWFIDFDPVRAKAEGRSTGLSDEISDLFPDSLEDSELGEIPREWAICTIDDLLDLEKNSINPMENPDEIFDHYSIPAFDNGLTPSKDIGFSIKSNKFLIPKNAFLVCKLNPRFPRVWLPSKSSSRKNISSTEFLVCRYKENIGLPFVYFLTKSKRVIQQMLNMATGTSSSHQRVRPKDFTSISTVRPNSKILDCFNNAISPILEKFLITREQNLLLTKCRNIILPKLISGELKISDAEKMIEGVGI